MEKTKKTNKLYAKVDELIIRVMLLDYGNSKTSESGLDLEIQIITSSALFG